MAVNKKMKNIIKKIDKEIKNKKNECWEYHKGMLRESDYCKSDIGDLDKDLNIKNGGFELVKIEEIK